MKLNAFSVRPFTKKPATSFVEKLPLLGSIVSAGFALATGLALLFLLVVAAGVLADDAVRGLAGGEGEMKNLLGLPLALMPSTIRLVSSTETM